MNKEEKIRAKCINNLTTILANEDRELRRINRYSWVCSILGFALATFAVLGMLNDTTPSYLVGIPALLGGLTIGLAIYFENSLTQWPVIKEFLNIEAIKDAAAKDA